MNYWFLRSRIVLIIRCLTEELIEGDRQLSNFYTISTWAAMAELSGAKQLMSTIAALEFATIVKDTTETSTRNAILFATTAIVSTSNPTLTNSTKTTRPISARCSNPSRFNSKTKKLILVSSVEDTVCLKRLSKLPTYNLIRRSSGGFFSIELLTKKAGGIFLPLKGKYSKKRKRANNTSVNTAMEKASTLEW